VPNSRRSGHLRATAQTAIAPPEPPTKRLAAWSAAFAAIGSALNLDAAALAQAEDLTRVELMARVALDRFAELSPAEVDGWFATLGADLEVEARLVGLGLEGECAPMTLRRHGAPDETYATFVAAAQERQASGGDALDVEVRVALAKSGAAAAAREALAARSGFLGSATALAFTTVSVFFSAEACMRTLLTPAALPLWESAGLARTDGRAVLVLLDSSGYLAAPALEVMGAREMAVLPWLDLDAAAWEASRGGLARARDLRDSECIWTITARCLTSGALAMEPRAPGLEQMAQGLAALREQLAAMEIATSVQAGVGADGALLLRFAGEPVRACMLPASTAEGAADERPSGDALSRLAAFAYASETPDRLYIARDSLAHGFPAATRITFAELERAAQSALPAAVATFNLYLRRQTDHYFSARQQAVDAVSAYAEGVRTAVSDLTSDVVSDVYKTAGLLVAVVIAALLGPAHALLLWQLGTLAYLAYLILIVCFLLPARARRFALDDRAIRDRLTTVSELTDAEKHDIWKMGAYANAYFRYYLRLSRWLYYGLAAAGFILLLVLVTPLGAHLPLVAPLPTVTPAIQPLPGA
jgi:hypothetical protein